MCSIVAGRFHCPNEVFPVLRFFISACSSFRFFFFFLPLMSQVRLFLRQWIGRA